MDDQNQNPNPNQPVTTPQNPVEPIAPVVPSSEPAEPAVPVEPVVPVVEDPNKDLQTLSKDLENLAQEAVKTEPVDPLTVAPAAAAVSEATDEKVASSDAKITIYTTNTCPFCKSEKEFLNEQHLAFTEKNVEENTEVLKEMLNVGDNFAGVPVTVLNGPKGKKVVKGFTKEEFIKELEEIGLKEPTPGIVPEPQTPADKPSDTPAAPAETPTVAPPETPKVPDLN